jgi:hypothetical protein
MSLDNEINSEDEIILQNIKCVICESTENKFGIGKRTCIKCICKKSNQKLKEKNYYKEYYVKNMDTLKEKRIKSYIPIPKEEQKQRGRKPKEIKEEETIKRPVGRPKKILSV